MAKQISATRDSKGEVPQDAPAAPPRELPNMPTDNDFQRVFTRLKVSDRNKEEVQAKARAMNEGAKAEFDAIMTEAVDALKARGIKKHVLRDMLAMSKRKEADIRQDFEAQVWAMRAAGFPIGRQLILFDEEFANQDEALRRATQRGRDDWADNKPQTASPYGQNGPAAQAYLSGWADAQNESILAMKTN